MYSRPAQCSAFARPSTASGCVTRRSSAIEGIDELLHAQGDLVLAHVQVLKNRVSVRARLRSQAHRGRELLHREAEVARHAWPLPPAQAGVDLGQIRVLPQKAPEERADRDLRAVARTPGVELVERVGDLVAGTAAGPAAAGRR